MNQILPPLIIPPPSTTIAVVPCSGSTDAGSQAPAGCAGGGVVDGISVTNPISGPDSDSSNAPSISFTRPICMRVSYLFGCVWLPKNHGFQLPLRCLRH